MKLGGLEVRRFVDRHLIVTVKTKQSDQATVKRACCPQIEHEFGNLNGTRLKNTWGELLIW